MICFLCHGWTCNEPEPAAAPDRRDTCRSRPTTPAAACPRDSKSATVWRATNPPTLEYTKHSWPLTRQGQTIDSISKRSSASYADGNRVGCSTANRPRDCMHKRWSRDQKKLVQIPSTGHWRGDRVGQLPETARGEFWKRLGQSSWCLTPLVLPWIPTSSLSPLAGSVCT
jgi:hypothetical protein